ncbi:cupin domain-containing protein [Kitasatospora sp. NBC_01287]|uniref:cupin domain-containing protein n=1 Tax=Kitasatospora sp. NBC_01287 TaxID=2903573 RepID=UPI00225B07B0|nr:cupin domain-containing protein [Kitasatospora sp. NBC_01287]MCX4750230.1 cupin domain-containing protein [Kitasatospora sp. NBC_01287]
MEIQRFVTGRRPDGSSVVDAHGPVDPVVLRALPGLEFFRIWGADGGSRVGSGAEEPVFEPYFPGTDGGFRFVLVTWPPDSAQAQHEPSAGDPAELLGEVERVFPGMLAAIAPDPAGRHATDTVDLVVILQGELWLELEDGTEAHLTPGSCVVQRGTRHAWHNRGDGPALAACVFLGAEPATG